MKKVSLFLVGFLCLFMLTSNVKAAIIDEVETLNNTIPFFETTDKFVVDNNVNVNELINGDLYVAGNNITINSNVYGDIIGVGNAISVTGDVGNSIRLAGSNLSFNNINVNNITVLGSNVLFINVNANKLYASGSNIEFTGVANNVNFSGSEVIINGTINGNSKIYADTVTIKDTAVIDGKLSIEASNDIVYIGNVVKDNIEYKKINFNKFSSKYDFVSEVYSLLFKIVSMFIIALIIARLFDNFVKRSIENIKDNKISTIIYGLFMFVGIPLLSILVFITIIGIPIAILAILSYIMFLIAASAFSAIAISKILFKDMNKYLGIFLSVVIISAISIIPVIGFIMWLLYVGYMLGSVSLLFKKEE